MKYLYLLLLLPFFSWGQSSDYYQQQVDYTIKVRLDDQAHFLRGEVNMVYHNNSPDTLKEIHLHLWPNAYSNKFTAFAQQQVDLGQLDFQFSKKAERGFIDSLQFSSQGQQLALTPHPEHRDIALLQLPQALLPGEKIELSTPMRLKIPGNFSRLAHVDQRYMLCQWYPKPAVYNDRGWQSMPYLDQGEFFSEYGNYDVWISLPSNYVLGATGSLQTEEEKRFLEQKCKETAGLNHLKITEEEQETPPSDSSYKTVHYKAENVHDFAWFANKDYHVQKGSFTLENGAEVESWIYYSNEEADLWIDALKYLERSTKYYSQRVGVYPYPKVMAVQGLYAGRDMEYPMITVIGRANSAEQLDNVITHEVGHNWFYGILGSNERQYAWMDEGMNSYIEYAYMQRYYQYNDRNIAYQSYLYSFNENVDQPINTPSAQLSSPNYYICAYARPAISFRYLEDYLGRKTMDKALNLYFEQWKFKHPYPQDLQKVLEQVSGKSLDWFFSALIASRKHIDYGIKGHDCCAAHGAELKLRNHGSIAAPFKLQSINGEGKVIEEQWIASIPPSTDSTIVLKKEAQRYQIDLQEYMPDIRRANNSYRTKGLQKKGDPLKVKFFADLSHPERPRLNFLPAMAVNKHDGFALGLALYNLPLASAHWEYSIAPLLGFGSLEPIGMGNVQYHLLPRKQERIQKWSIGLNVQRFNKRRRKADDIRNFDFQEAYIKYNIFTKIKLKRKDRIQHCFRLDNMVFNEANANIQRDTSTAELIYLGNEHSYRSTHRLQHELRYLAAHTPITLLSSVEYANYEDYKGRQHYVKLTVEGNFKIHYNPKQAVAIRLFTGGFLLHTDREYGDMPLRLIANTGNDYHYDDFLLGRSVQDHFLEQQVSLREGGFKTPIERRVDNGSSNHFIFALNFKADLPIRFPIRSPYFKIKPYMDLGYFHDPDLGTMQEKLFFNGGLLLDIWDGAAGVYFPLFGNKVLMDKVKTFSGDNFARRISFSFNLEKLHPRKIADEFIF